MPASSSARELRTVMWPPARSAMATSPLTRSSSSRVGSRPSRSLRSKKRFACPTTQPVSEASSSALLSTSSTSSTFEHSGARQSTVPYAARQATSTCACTSMNPGIKGRSPTSTISVSGPRRSLTSARVTSRSMRSPRMATPWCASASAPAMVISRSESTMRSGAVTGSPRLPGRRPELPRWLSA